jgi:hypothetical protein
VYPGHIYLYAMKGFLGLSNIKIKKSSQVGVLGVGVGVDMDMGVVVVVVVVGQYHNDMGIRA